MVWQVYLEIERLGGASAGIPIDKLVQRLNMEAALTIEYLRSLQILEYVHYDESNNLVKLLQ